MTYLQKYIPSLYNSLDDIESFNPDDYYLYDIVHFTAYHDADEGGFGTIVKFCDWEYFNEGKCIFETLPSVVVESVLPDEQWLDYVPLTHLTDVYTYNELIEEYLSETDTETDTKAVQALRVSIDNRVQESKQRHTISDRNVPQVRRNRYTIQMA